MPGLLNSIEHRARGNLVLPQPLWAADMALQTDPSRTLIGMEALEAMTIVELKRLCKHVGVAVSGAKGELVLRLLQKPFDEKDFQEAQQFLDIDVSDAHVA